MARRRIGFDPKTGKTTPASGTGGRLAGTPPTGGGVKVRIDGGGTQTITRTGQVTVRDETGKFVERFRITQRQAERAVRERSSSVQKRLADQIRFNQTKKGVEAFFGTSEKNIEKMSRQFGVSSIKPTIKVFRDSRGRIIGVQDSATKKSFRVEPGSVTVAQVALVEGIRSANKQVKIHNARIKKFNDELKKVVSPILLAVTKTKLKDDLAKFIKTGDFTGIREKLGDLSRKQTFAATRQAGTERGVGTVERIFRGVVVAGLLGGVRGVAEVFNAVRRPDKFVVSQVKALKTPRKTFIALGQQFEIDPAGTIAEFLIFSKTLNLVGKGIKRSPVGRFVQEELFIRGQPKEIRPFVRAIVKSSKIQEKINPSRIKALKKVDFLEVKSLTKTEGRALGRTIASTDSVVFGSAAARTLSRKRTPLPKDVDVATRSIRQFNQTFINNLPKKIRRNYLLKGQKLIRKSNGQALYDIKPINRLIPQRSFLTGRGRLPVVGFVRKLGLKKGSLLPVLKKKKVVGKLTVPTQKIVKVKGIRLVGFGEQTTRKALGTLQVLIEKNVRRAKDPQSFLISLEVQLRGLRGLKSKSPFVKRRISVLSNSIRILRSKEFSRLLESKVPGITKNFPLLKSINVGRLKRINNKFVKRRVAETSRRINLIKKELVNVKRIKKKSSPVRNRINELSSEISRFSDPSRLPPSRLPKSFIPSKLIRKRVPSKLPPSRIGVKKAPSKMPPSKLPSSMVFKVPSKVPGIPKSFIPLSKLPPSRLPPSRLPPSRLVPSKIPPSRIPLSKLPKFRPRKVFVPKKIPILPEKRKVEKLKSVIDKSVKSEKLIFISDLYSVVYDVKASLAEKKAFLRAGRLFTGFERRKLIKK